MMKRERKKMNEEKRREKKKTKTISMNYDMQSVGMNDA